MVTVRGMSRAADGKILARSIPGRDRTYSRRYPDGELFGHVANAQFNACSQAKGEANPNQGVNNEEKHMKADAVRARLVREGFTQTRITK